MVRAVVSLDFFGCLGGLLAVIEDMIGYGVLLSGMHANAVDFACADLENREEKYNDNWHKYIKSRMS